ncbi:MAG: phage protease [Negativicutes bacterium]|nr:phage protease [Negativicutes bacterium]
MQLLPYGLVKTEKGEFLVDETALEEILAAFSAKTNDIVTDYEHQTLKDVVAPAAGWVKSLENRVKDGLWGFIEWNSKAKEFIQNKEYRYVSPVILVRKSDKRAVYLHSVGLTNLPAIDGMTPLANKLLGVDPDYEEETEYMDFLKRLAVLLGLLENASEDDIVKAVGILNGQSQDAMMANKEIRAALDLPETAKPDEVKTKILALKTTAASLVANKDLLAALDLPETANLADAKGKIIALKNPSGLVSVEEFNAIKTKLALRDRDELVTMALKDGKVAPAQKAWAEEYALKDPTGFKAFLAIAPVVVPVGQNIGGDHFESRRAPEPEMQLSINKQLGISDADFKKYGE